MRIVVSYDISNDKRRRKVVKILEGTGFRMQYSVFECDLDRKQLATLKKRLKPYVEEQTTDSIRFYPLSKWSEERIEVFGNDLTKTMGGILIV